MIHMKIAPRWSPAAVAGVLALSPVAWAQQDVEFIGGSGSWNSAGDWNPAVVPNNNLSNEYNALIGSGGDVLLSGIDPIVNNVEVRDFGVLTIDNSTLSAKNFSTGTNFFDSGFLVGMGNASILANNVELYGRGMIGTPVVDVPTGSNTLTLGNGGVVDITMLPSFSNAVQVGSGAELTLDSSNAVIRDGVIELSGGTLRSTGLLTIDSENPASFSGGTVINADGTIDARFTSTGRAGLMRLTGDLDVGRHAAVDGYDFGASVLVNGHTLRIGDADEAMLGRTLDLAGTDTSGPTPVPTAGRVELIGADGVAGSGNAVLSRDSAIRGTGIIQGNLRLDEGVVIATPDTAIHVDGTLSGAGVLVGDVTAEAVDFNAPGSVRMTAQAESLEASGQSVLVVSATALEVENRVVLRDRKFSGSPPTPTVVDAPNGISVEDGGSVDSEGKVDLSGPIVTKPGSDLNILPGDDLDPERKTRVGLDGGQVELDGSTTIEDNGELEFAPPASEVGGDLHAKSNSRISGEGDLNLVDDATAILDDAEIKIKTNAGGNSKVAANNAKFEKGLTLDDDASADFSGMDGSADSVTTRSQSTLSVAPSSAAALAEIEAEGDSKVVAEDDAKVTGKSAMLKQGSSMKLKDRSSAEIDQLELVDNASLTADADASVVSSSMKTAPGASVEIGDAELDVDDLDLSGSLKVRTGANAKVKSGDAKLKGEVEIGDGGSLEVKNADGTAGGDIKTGEDTVLSGSGTINAGSLEMSGAWKPGSSPGLQVVHADVTLMPNSFVEFELAALQRATLDAPGDPLRYDGIDVFGDLHLDGQLQIALLNDLADQLTGPEVFTLITVNDGFISGSFSNIGLDARVGIVGHPGSFLVNVSPNEVTISQFVIPEPVTVGLLGLGGLILLTRRNRIADEPASNHG